MASLVLLLGSNSYDKQSKICEAEEHISSILAPVQKRSAFYETEPWGFQSAESFLNRVLILQTDIGPEECLKKCLSIEQSMGRIRGKKKYESRTIDIDILFYGQEIVNKPALVLPHPRLQLRRFVLVPLGELMPDFVHPILNKSISSLLGECPDTCWVRQLPEQD